MCAFHLLFILLEIKDQGIRVNQPSTDCSIASCDLCVVDLHSDASVAFDFHGADDGEFDGAIYSEGMIRRFLMIGRYLKSPL